MHASVSELTPTMHDLVAIASRRGRAVVRTQWTSCALARQFFSIDLVIVSIDRFMPHPFINASQGVWVSPNVGLGISRCRQIRMLYRGKQCIVTITFDGHWAWVVILSSRLSIRGRAITKFEAIEQATHLIDRIIWFRTPQSIPRSRHEQLKSFVFGFLKQMIRRLLASDDVELRSPEKSCKEVSRRHSHG